MFDILRSRKTEKSSEYLFFEESVPGKTILRGGIEDKELNVVGGGNLLGLYSKEEKGEWE